jgi:type VI secretion system protein ImpE
LQNARTLFDAGRLGEAVHALNQAVRSRPTAVGLRVFLFELLCFQGDLARAERQLAVLARDRTAGFAVRRFRSLLTAEAQRRAVFAGAANPSLMGVPPIWLNGHLALLKRHGDVRARDAGTAPTRRAAAEAPPIAGTRGGVAFASLRDADERLGAVLEVMLGADYAWLPFEQIRHLEIRPPTRLRDLLWARARVQIEGDGCRDVFVPALYVNSHCDRNDAVRLGRSTVWRFRLDRVVGAGLRTLLVDDEELSLFDLGSVDLVGAEVDRRIARLDRQCPPTATEPPTSGDAPKAMCDLAVGDLND